MPMPMMLRILVLASCIAIGAVLVRHITEALQGIPVTQQAAVNEQVRR